MQHLLENYDKEVCEASKSLNKGKHFFKCSIPVRKQCKNLYLRNLVLNAKLRSMKKTLDKAQGPFKKYKEVVKAPSPGRVQRLISKALSETKLTLPIPTENKDPTPQDSKTQASTSKTSNKRKRR